MPDIICEESKCLGCFSCYNSCPKGCIEMVENKYDCLIPKINKDKCIECNLCVKKCPVNNKFKGTEPLDTYASYNVNNEDRESCSSGGVATVLSRKVISEGGVVYGAIVDEKLEVIIKEASTIADVEKLKGSKYVQSAVKDSYKNVKKNLEENKTVLFTGTPCQVDGLYHYLGKEYDNLITLDLICHGVPPYKYLKEHIKKVSKVDLEKITNITFRGKQNFSLSLYSDNKIIYTNKSNWDYYFIAFLKGLFYRENCYSCRYAGKKRVSDITLGDFWGLGKNVPFENKDNKRISAVLINSKKGEKLFLDCKDDLFIEKRTLEEAVNGNPQLRNPSHKHRRTDKFREYYLKYGFEKALFKSIYYERGKEILKTMRNKCRKIYR